MELMSMTSEPEGRDGTQTNAGGTGTVSTGPRWQACWGALLPLLPSLLAGAACTPRAPAPLPAASSDAAPSETDRGQLPARQPDAGSSTQRAALVVWLTIDQMRAESLTRSAYLMGPRGFARLLDGGLVYRDASYRHAITETAPGHATLFTGAAPSTHGIVGNSWLLPDGRKTTSVEDPSVRLLGPALSTAELEPNSGSSPHWLLSPTVGDELSRASAGRGRVVSLSAKDRGAILPAGFTGKAFWLGRAGFVTSSYYEAEVPTWLERHHAAFPPERYLDGGWPLLLPPEAYRRPESTHPLRTAKFSAAFPHRVAAGQTAASVLKLTPYGDQAVLDLARSALEAYQLGQDDEPDLLALSLSSTDYVGHYFGPDSREAEDNFARLDRNLAEFWDFVSERVGWERTVILLSADHGISGSPEELSALRLPARRILADDLTRVAREALTARFGAPKALLGIAAPSVYLDPTELKRKALDRGAVLETLVRAFEAVPGIRRAVRPDQLGADDLSAQVAASLSPGRSGDLYLVVAPYSQIDADGDLVATHGSPYTYDRQVPLLLSGPGIPERTVTRAVDIRSVAGTVAALLGLPQPPAAEAPLLAEALGGSSPEARPD